MYMNESGRGAADSHIISNAYKTILLFQFSFVTNQRLMPDKKGMHWFLEWTEGRAGHEMVRRPDRTGACLNGI